MNDAITLSPLQLKQLIYTRVRIDAYEPENFTEEFWGPNFDFEGVGINIQVGLPGSDDEHPIEHIVNLRFAISNSAKLHKKSPYTIDIEAQAHFELAPNFREGDIIEREKIVRVNGASIILGSVRDMIHLLTARSMYGPITVPTLKFAP